MMSKIKSKVKKIESQRGTESSSNAVKFALAGNVCNTAMKFATFLVTGSSTMLSEALHSFGDVFNQSLLLFGVKTSQRPPTQEYPYGFEGRRFVFSLISACGIFSIGAIYSIYTGIASLVDPGELQDLWLGLIVLSFSFVVEIFSFSRGLLAVMSGARDSQMGIIEFILKGADPMGVAVVLEDGTALVGVAMATICLGMSYITGNPIWDAIGSIFIGTLLGIIAMFLIVKNIKALTTRAAPQQLTDAIVDVLLKDNLVLAVNNIKSVQMGAESVDFRASLTLNGKLIMSKFLTGTTKDIKNVLKTSNDEEVINQTLLDIGSGMTSQVGAELDRLEVVIKSQFPQVKWVHLDTNKD